MRRFSDKAGNTWVALESVRPYGLPERRKGGEPVVSVAFSCDDGTQVAMDMPIGQLEGLSDQELLFLLSKGIKPS
jgi:hypothetical protein